MVLLVAIAPIATPVNTLVNVTSCGHVGVVGCFVIVASPLFASIIAAISLATRVTMMPRIAFVIVSTRARLPHVVLTIGPTVGGFHQIGDSLRQVGRQPTSIKFCLLLD
jgi:hypothetical protein